MISATTNKNILQPKLKIGQPNDRFEQEADAVADQVMRMPQPQSAIQPKCEKCGEELQMKSLTQTITPIIQKQEEAEEELQMKGKSNEAGSINGLESTLQQSKGGGQSMDTATQNQMSRSIGADFSGVKVHTGSSAIQMNRQLNAKAFNNGNDVYFNQGEYNPSSGKGKHLLAHELTHTIQQKGTDTIQRVFEANPVEDIELILGSAPPSDQSFLASSEQTLELYQYLKKVRTYDSGKNQLAINVLELYFPDYSMEVWSQSKDALAGYTGMRVTGAKKRLKIAEEKGMVKAEGKTAKDKSLGSDIVFYSGHQWASTKYDSDDRCKGSPYGCAGVFHDQETGPDIKKSGLTSPKVKLVFISSCNGLNHNGRRLYSKLYPNAYILGWVSNLY